MENFVMQMILKSKYILNTPKHNNACLMFLKERFSAKYFNSFNIN